MPNVFFQALEFKKNISGMAPILIYYEYQIPQRRKNPKVKNMFLRHFESPSCSIDQWWSMIQLYWVLFEGAELARCWIMIYKSSTLFIILYFYFKFFFKFLTDWAYKPQFSDYVYKSIDKTGIPPYGLWIIKYNAAIAACLDFGSEILLSLSIS